MSVVVSVCIYPTPVNNTVQLLRSSRNAGESGREILPGGPVCDAIDCKSESQS